MNKQNVGGTAAGMRRICDQCQQGIHAYEHAIGAWSIKHDDERPLKATDDQRRFGGRMNATSSEGEESGESERQGGSDTADSWNLSSLLLASAMCESHCRPVQHTTVLAMHDPFPCIV